MERNNSVRVRSNARGLFRAAGLKPGAYCITASSYDFLGELRFAIEKVASIPAGSRDVVIHLRRAAKIKGIVLEADGTPAGNTLVEARTIGSAAEPAGWIVDETGHFTITVAEGETVDLEAYPPSGRRGGYTRDSAHAAHLSGVRAGSELVEMHLPRR